MKTKVVRTQRRKKPLDVPTEGSYVGEADGVSGGTRQARGEGPELSTQKESVPRETSRSKTRPNRDLQAFSSTCRVARRLGHTTLVLLSVLEAALDGSPTNGQRAVIDDLRRAGELLVGLWDDEGSDIGF